MLQLHAACCSGMPSQAQGPSGRNSLNYPPAQLASVIAMGPLFTKTSLTQRRHHHGDGEGVGDRVLYVVTVVIKPLAFMRCMAVACACTQYACRKFRNSDRSATPPAAETRNRAVFLGILSHTHFCILNIKAVLIKAVPPCAAVPKKHYVEGDARRRDSV